ncbi:MAG: hypothetical protein ACD_51C00327G0006 [uncultured bacterium]|nr:MAG: hypothetical protein ACD_51C00327G0006 [uncultured bacterium]OGJ48057.1 MAG: hypothetical protein A2244_01025 [Candidatus Peregrinibacteria bacterium RIFOXYA2_FULL_41_18]OGJ48755.1 MAG: hypothetical protein A2344_01990 [Candidatus Peregrinibacteria bacterium RIFOXYB12_FULL_41_12]OGJ53101.1 MAG: hypothetical protein A2448_03665 [Candidatus Peregrinibacteria bacterium RIFOXYC2_FULL_41_22]OGJ53447.1 MAG: hypothetical protein A2336_01140 [Candidatus Peregrinibacteria bacterium RIFOXYB2_FULL
MNEISVIIPAYNEEKIISENLRHVFSYLKNNFGKFEIIVVSDGSKDGTRDEVKKINESAIRVIEYHPNRGKGFAVRTGVLDAKYGHVLFMDADLSTPIEELSSLWKYANSHDVVIASRALFDSKIENPQPFFRRLFGLLGKKIIGLFVVRGIKDTQCGFKLFKLEAARKLFEKQKINRWGFDFEIMFLAQKFGYTIKEVPVVWYARIESKLKLKDYITTLFELISLRLRRY